MEDCIKIPDLYYDCTGRAYPPNPENLASWDKVYMYRGKRYVIVGGTNSKEWEELGIALVHRLI